MDYPAFNQFTRRDLLRATSCGFGYLALSGLAADAVQKDVGYTNPLAEKKPHFPARAKRVIFMFMQGGPSHLDTFDYKPALQKAGGKGDGKSKLLASPFQFEKHGESGTPISSLYPHLAKHADDMCVLNGMHTTSPAHPQATIAAHTGSINFVRPSMGAWVTYGLGSVNEDLPGFITINPVNNLGGAQNYGSAFLPASYQGTRVGTGNGSISNIANPVLNTEAQRRQLDLVQSMNKDMLERNRSHAELEGVIESYELAFRMQTSVPDVMDLSKESESTKNLYGIGEKSTNDFGTQCLMARRLAEAGVRFIQVTHRGWDQHNNLSSKLKSNCGATDKPIAALLTDLKRRGMLKDTLIVWGGEFGRSPQGQNKDGRRHNNRGYSMWMAGGGVKGGLRYGSTDDLGGTAIDGKMHTHDLHATILHLLGLDHEKLTYRYAGRDFRLTDVHGIANKDILA
ncbi:MAG: hypothetical protein ACI8XO_001228 [Verrucomicrobiales bacterium]|jgi:hypothetical protein